MPRRKLFDPARTVAKVRSWSHAHRLQRFTAPVLTVVVCALLLAVFQHLSQTVDYKSVMRQLRHLPLDAWGAALFATALSFGALIGRDAVGLRHVGVQVPRSLLWVGATVGSALGNATGFGALTGGAVRCRVYGAADVTPAQIGRLTVFTSVTLALSLVLMTAVGMIVSADTLARMMPLSPVALRAAGAALVAVFAVMIACCGAAPRTLAARWTWLRFTIPARRDFVAQIVLAIVDVIAAGLALWALLPHAQVGFGDFITVFSAAMLLGMIGHTPGGVGVFEASMVFALGGTVQTPEMVAALLAYRAIYFGVPLILSAGVMAAFEGRALKGRFAFLRPRHVSQLAPLFLSIVTFVAGSMLVISGATPAFAKRIATLQTILPLWVLESSQLLGSVLGVLLLFVARGLLRRLDAAWWLALILAVANLALSLAKGLAFVEAGVLGFLIVLLFATRERFNRRSSLFAERFTATWLASVGVVMVLAVWIMFFAFRDVPYSGDLWWQFAFDNRAPRALRATLAAVAVRRRLRDVAIAASGRWPIREARAAGPARRRAHFPRAGAQRRRPRDDGRQELPVFRVARGVPDVREARPHVGRAARSGRSAPRMGGTDPQVRRARACAQRPRGVLPGARRRAAALSRRRPHADEARRGSACRVSTISI